MQYNRHSQPSNNVTVFGSGSWGTSLAVLLAHNFDTVFLIGRNNDVAEDINHNHRNTQYLGDIELSENIVASTTLKPEHLTHGKFVIVVPSKAFATTIAQLKQTLSEQREGPETISIVWGTKGIDPETNTLLSDIAQRMFANAKLGVISGPSFAKETANGLPTALTVASDSLADAQSFTDWFARPTTRIYYHDDLIGVQLGGAIKNVLAIAAGISDGLGFGANARSALITRGLSELVRLGTALGGRPETFMGLTGIGDLILTCTDNQSRNRRFGMGLGQGKQSAQIKQEIGQEIEGIQTVREVFELKNREQIDMPISEAVYHIIYSELDPKEAVSQLLSRQIRAE